MEFGNASETVIEKLLKALFEKDEMTLMQQLAIVTQIRINVSKTDQVDMSKLLDSSNILIRMINQIIGLQETADPLIRYLKLEASWILVNISVASHHEIEVIFNSDF